MSKPTVSDWSDLTRTMEYVAGTPHGSIVYRRDEKVNEIAARPGTPMILVERPHAYSDSDWASCQKTRRSISGYVFLLCGGPISWSSKQQNIVAQSSTEAEYIALAETSKQGLYLRQIYSQIVGKEPPSVTIFADNQSAIKLAKNPIVHQRTKHIDARYHFIREEVKKGTIQIAYTRTTENTADIFTKPLSPALFCACVERLLRFDLVV